MVRHTVVAVEVAVGALGEVVEVVAHGDTAVALGSGGLPVLATPRLLAWCEAATCRAVEGGLPPGSSSVGTSVQLEHLAASAVGERVTVRAELLVVEGRRLRFRVEATDAVGTVLGRGTVERVVVDDARFLARLAGGRDPDRDLAPRLARLQRVRERQSLRLVEHPPLVELAVAHHPPGQRLPRHAAVLDEAR